MNRDLINEVILIHPNHKDTVTKSITKLNELAQRANFEQCIPMINVESSWIEPVSGYVAKLKSDAPFVAEPFLIDMFRGHTVLMVELDSSLITLKKLKSIAYILNGTIMEDSPQPFNINNPSDPWIPSLGRRNSYVGLYTAHIAPYQTCIICNAGLDEKVVHSLQNFFVQQEHAKKTYREVLTSSLIDKIRRYSTENRKRIIHTFGQVIGILPPDDNTSIEHIPDTQTKRITEDSSKKLFAAVKYYCTDIDQCVVSTSFVFPKTDDVLDEFKGYPLGPTLNHLHKRQRKAFDKLNNILKSSHNKSVTLINTYNVHPSDTTHLHAHMDTEYNHVSSANNMLVFFSGCSSTNESGGKIIVSRHPEYGPTIFFNGNTLNKTQRWGNVYGDAFHAYTNHIGTHTSEHNLPPEPTLDGFISLHKLINNNYYRHKRTDTPPKVIARLGFDTLHGTVIKCRKLLVKFTQ